MKLEQQHQELHCDKCHKRTAARVSDVLEEFCEKTSTRGLPRAVREQSRTWACLWYTSVLLLFLFAVWQICLLCAQYFSYGVVQQETTRRDVRVDFPSITVCNLNPIALDDRDKAAVKNVPTHLQSLKSFYAHLDALQNKYPSMQQYIEQLRSTEGFYHNIPKSMHHLYGHSVFDLVNTCTIRIANGFSGVRTKNCSTIRIMQSPLFYNCFTVQVDSEDAHIAKSLSLILYLDDNANHIIQPEAETSDMFGHSLGVNVFVHEANTFPDIGHSSTRFGPGVSGRVDLKPRLWRELGQQYSNCAGQEVAKARKLENAGLLLHYSRVGCLAACLQRQLANACGCVEPSWPLPLSMAERLPYCMNASLSLLDLKRRIDCRETVQQHEEFCSSLCPYKCSRVQFTQRVTSSAWPLAANQLAFYKQYIASRPYAQRFSDYKELARLASSGEPADEVYRRLVAKDQISRSFLQVSVHRDFDLRVIDEQPAFGFNQLLSGIGGIFSLTIGITMITAIEVVELLYRLCLFACWRSQWRRVSSRAETVLCDCDLGF